MKAFNPLTPLRQPLASRNYADRASLNLGLLGL